MLALPVIAVFLTAFATAQNSSEPVTGALGNATVVQNNPPGVVYTAVLPTKEFFNPSDPRGNVKGSVSAVANPNGIGVKFTVSFENLPTSGGPFIYHLHDAPVPASGNCTATLAHLDPFQRGEATPCNASLPQTCQVGDLSGKYGKISSDPFTATYSDDWASTLPGLGSFFGNRSIVLHFGNKTRITCANFTLDTAKGGNTSTTTTTSATTISSATSTSSATTTTSAPAQFTGAAVRKGVEVTALLGAVVGFAALL